MLLVAACNSTKWVPPGERLLTHNTVTVDPHTLNVDELAPILKQKPNKRVLGRTLYLDFYNLRDPEKVARKRARKDSLCVLKNEEIRLKDSLKMKECDASARGRSGEAPVLLDSSLVRRTSEQLRNYAFKEGWFAAEVRDTIRYTRRTWPFGGWGHKPYTKPKANVEYIVQAGHPWTICMINHRVDDPSIAAFLREDSINSLLKPGDRFDGDVIDAERARITKEMKILGYVYFTKDMVLFDADTSAGDHEVDLLMRLERPLATTQRGLKGTPPGTVYYVNDVFIDATRRTKANALLPYDTIHYDGFSLLYRGKRPEFRPRPITASVLMKPNARFNQNDADRTFRRLTNLRVFDRVDIIYDTTGLGRGNVNARLSLVPSKRQGFSVEGFGTNRGGFLGTSLNFNYKHRNVLRTMTSLQASVTLGFEAQQSLNDQSASGDASTSIGQGLFNTVVIGPEVKMTIPVKAGSAKSGGSRVVISALYNYQRRPDYTRTLAKGALGWEINPTFTETWGIYFPEVNLIRISQQDPRFTAFLDSTQDFLLKNSFTDHIIINLPRIAYTWNSAAVQKKRNAHFLRGSIDFAGTLLRWYDEATGAPLVTDSTAESYFEFDDFRFAEYVKLDLDYRFYHTIHDRSSIAFRFAPGIAKPMVNQMSMPFETSFYSGGANGIRAWRARSLGPGGYQEKAVNFDRIGEVRIEGNVEYRFKLFGYLEGALFTDVGNIWSLRKNDAKPEGQFKVEKFVSEIAVGTGLGARLNFDFFLVRFDLGLQTKDPSFPAGQRWIFQPHDPQYQTDLTAKLNFNLGIGYPF